jgi:hypothetical protein
MVWHHAWRTTGIALFSTDQYIPTRCSGCCEFMMDHVVLLIIGGGGASGKLEHHAASNNVPSKASHVRWGDPASHTCQASAICGGNIRATVERHAGSHVCHRSARLQQRRRGPMPRAQQRHHPNAPLCWRQPGPSRHVMPRHVTSRPSSLGLRSVFPRSNLARCFRAL